MEFVIFSLLIFIGGALERCYAYTRDHKKVLVMGGIKAYAISDDAFKLQWEAPNITNAQIMYNLHINEIEPEWSEDEYCFQVMPGLLMKTKPSALYGVNVTTSPATPTTIVNSVNCFSLTFKMHDLTAPQRGKMACYTMRDRTQVIVRGINLYAKYRAKIQACFTTMGGLCGSSVSTVVALKHEDPYLRMRHTVMKGNEPADATGTLLLMEWTTPPDDSLRAFAVVLRLDNKKAVVLCRTHEQLVNKPLSFAVLIVGPGYCRVSVRAASAGGWHKWHEIGGFYPRSIKELQARKHREDSLENEASLSKPGEEEDESNTLFPRESEIVSFTKPDAHIAIAPVEFGRTFNWEMSVRTKSADGLIMYVANDDQTVAMSASFVEGRVVILVDPGGNKTDLVSNSKTLYNDGEWHRIRLIKYGGRLVLRVDEDPEVYQRSYSGNKKLDTRMPIFFGGTPSGYKVLQQNVGTSIGFVGCIKDVQLKGRKIDFAKSIIVIRNKDIHISKECHLVKFTPSTIFPGGLNQSFTKVSPKPMPVLTTNKDNEVEIIAIDTKKDRNRGHVKEVTVSKTKRPKFPHKKTIHRTGESSSKVSKLCCHLAANLLTLIAVFLIL